MTLASRNRLRDHQPDAGARRPVHSTIHGLKRSHEFDDFGIIDGGTLTSNGPSAAVLHPGVVFQHRYRVIRCIKAGGMGAVYEVVDERTNSPRALKVMLPSIVEDADLRARFALEAKITGNIVSDHIVRVSDAGIDESSGTPFLVMDLLLGTEVGSLLKKRGPLPPSEVVTYLQQSALALDKTHAAGIIHRDLKPENLFITYRDDGSVCVKILDFGIAKVVAQSSTQGTQAVGTPVYMAPEQIRGDGAITSRADIYALAQIAYTLMVGEPYWQEDLKSSDSIYPFLTKVIAGIHEKPSDRALRRRGISLPAAVDQWFLRATMLRPEDRFDRATSAIEALAAAWKSSESKQIPPEIELPAIIPSPDPPTEVLPQNLFSPSLARHDSNGQHARPSGTTSVAVTREASLRSQRSSAPLVVVGLIVTGMLVALSIGFFVRSPPDAKPGIAASVTIAPMPSAPPTASAASSFPAPEGEATSQTATTASAVPTAAPTVTASTSPVVSSVPAAPLRARSQPAPVPTSTKRGIY